MFNIARPPSSNACHKIRCKSERGGCAMLNLGGAGGLLINLVVEVVQDFVLQQSLHKRLDHIRHASYFSRRASATRSPSQVQMRYECAMLFTAHSLSQAPLATLARLLLLAATPGMFKDHARKAGATSWDLPARGNGQWHREGERSNGVLCSGR